MSSLRSHFERFAHHDHPPRAARRSVTPDSLTQIKSLNYGRGCNERLSLDSPRTGPTSDQSSMLGYPGARQHVGGPTRSASHWVDAESPRQSRPVSTHPVVLPRYSPPVVTIQSPSSPQRALGVPESTPGTSGQQDMVKIKNASPRQSESSITTVAPVPNRASKPTLQSRPTHRPVCPARISESGIRSQSR